MRRAHLAPPIVLILGVAFTVPGCEFWPQLADRAGKSWSWRRSSGYLSKFGHVTGPGYEVIGYRYDGMWNVEQEPDKLVHIVFVPHGVACGIATVLSPDGPPATTDITLYADALYLRDVPVHFGPGRRVFVYTKHRQLHPVALTAEELKALTPNGMERLAGTKAWQKIKAVLDEEEWCVGCQVPPTPVEAPRPNRS